MNFDNGVAEIMRKSRREKRDDVSEGRESNFDNSIVKIAAAQFLCPCWTAQLTKKGGVAEII